MQMWGQVDLCMREMSAWRPLKTPPFVHWHAHKVVVFCLGCLVERKMKWMTTGPQIMLSCLASQGATKGAKAGELKQEATNDEHVVLSFGLLPTEEHEHLCSQEEMWKGAQWLWKGGTGLKTTRLKSWRSSRCSRILSACGKTESRMQGGRRRLAFVRIIERKVASWLRQGATARDYLVLSYPTPMGSLPTSRNCNSFRFANRYRTTNSVRWPTQYVDEFAPQKNPMCWLVGWIKARINVIPFGIHKSS